MADNGYRVGDPHPAARLLSGGRKAGRGARVLAGVDSMPRKLSKEEQERLKKAKPTFIIGTRG